MSCRSIVYFDTTILSWWDSMGIEWEMTNRMMWACPDMLIWRAKQGSTRNFHEFSEIPHCHNRATSQLHTHKIVWVELAVEHTPKKQHFKRRDDEMMTNTQRSQTCGPLNVHLQKEETPTLGEKQLNWIKTLDVWNLFWANMGQPQPKKQLLWTGWPAIYLSHAKERFSSCISKVFSRIRTSYSLVAVFASCMLIRFGANGFHPGSLGQLGPQFSAQKESVLADLGSWRQLHHTIWCCIQLYILLGLDMNSLLSICMYVKIYTNIYTCKIHNFYV